MTTLRPLRAGLGLGALLALAALTASACQNLIGLEERHLDPVTTDGGGDGGAPPSAQCVEYCDTVLANCTGPLAVYSSRETCLGVCRLLPAGDALEPVGNTVACRLKQAENAGSFEPDLACPAAGPGGAGTCGDDCDAYCGLLEQICPTEFAQVPGCKQHCLLLPDAQRFDVVKDHDGDTRQCRLVHVSSASVLPSPHCEHAKLIATTPCTDPETEPVDCDEICKLEMGACTGPLAQFESSAQCLAVCHALPPGTAADTAVDSAWCRRYHSYSSFADPAQHCSHTGPTGDGHCGKDVSATDLANCHGYCDLLRKACSDFDSHFATQDACALECASLPDGAKDAKFAVTPEPTGATLACRLRHVARALEAPADAGSECVAAYGGSPCQ